MTDPVDDVLPPLDATAPTAVPGHLRRRTLRVLVAAQVLSGLAAGTVVSVGSPLAVQLSGAAGWAGSVTTATTLGAAVAALGLARLAVAHGRRRALSTGLALASTGAVGVVVAAAVASFPLLLAAGVLMGVGAAVNLQSRFAATDLSSPSTRARDLSLVVWAGTVGAVVGPNLVGLNAPLARLTGLPEHAPVFVIAALGMLAALLVVQVALRPDPLDVAGRTGGIAGERRRVPLREAFGILRRHPQALGALVGVLVVHGVMVAVMSTTAVHMEGHGASGSLVGFTVSLHLAAMFALSPLMGLLADRVGARPALLVGLGTVVAACSVTATAGGEHLPVTVGLVLLGLGWSAATVAGSSAVATAVPGPERVAVQGVSDSAMSLAGAGGGALAGVWLEVVGYGGLGAVSGVAAAVGAVGVVLVSRDRTAAGAPAPVSRA